MNRAPEAEERRSRTGGHNAGERLLAAIPVTAAEASARVAGVDLTPQLLEFERTRLALFARYGFPGQSRWVADREGRSTYMISRGEGPSPTILVHGGLSQAGEWSLLAGRLPRHVIIPDRPGCGLSYKIEYRRADYRKAAAAWLLDLVDGIGADQIDLVGNSIGGFFAMAFALAHPDRVRHLVLAGAPAGLDRSIPLFPRLWGNPVTGLLIRKLKITDPETLRKRAVRMGRRRCVRPAVKRPGHGGQDARRSCRGPPRRRSPAVVRPARHRCRRHRRLSGPLRHNVSAGPSVCGRGLGD